MLSESAENNNVIEYLDKIKKTQNKKIPNYAQKKAECLLITAKFLLEMMKNEEFDSLYETIISFRGKILFGDEYIDPNPGWKIGLNWWKIFIAEDEYDFAILNEKYKKKIDEISVLSKKIWKTKLTVSFVLEEGKLYMNMEADREHFI